jgi:hypothetical protein
MTSADIQTSSFSGADALSPEELRELVIGTLNSDPDATFEEVHAHLRSREGRTLHSSETDQLRAAYDAELAHPTGAHRIGAVEAADIAAHRPFALRRTEMVGLAAGLLPFIIHLQTTSPSTTAKVTGVVTRGGVYDLAAIVGGFIAVVLGISAARQAAKSSARRAIHFALAALVLLLGIYQSLLGLGLLHKMGLFGAV